MKYGMARIDALVKKNRSKPWLISQGWNERRAVFMVPHARGQRFIRSYPSKDLAASI
jgi:hypothetical protein